MRRKVLLCAACALAMSAPPAQATFPGQNGQIAFESDRPSAYDRHHQTSTSGRSGRTAQYDPRNLTPDSLAYRPGPELERRWARWFAFTSGVRASGRRLRGVRDECRRLGPRDSSTSNRRPTSTGPAGRRTAGRIVF